MPGRRKDFWELVDKSGACWLWTGTRTAKGYPVFRRRYAHRVSVELSGRVIPAGMQVDHACRTPLCVNPTHLQVVSNAKNAENRSGAYRNSRSGIRGVSWHRRAGKWIVQVTSGGVVHYGGLHDSLDQATRAAVDLRNRLMTNNLLDRSAS